MKENERRSFCPINYGLELFGDKWSLLILRDLMFKEKSSYGAFLKSEEGIATNILANKLQTMEQAGIIFKETNANNKSKLDYKLTAKGIDLAPMLVELIIWSAKYDKDTAADKGFVAKAKTNRAELLKEIKKGLKEGN